MSTTACRCRVSIRSLRLGVLLAILGAGFLLPLPSRGQADEASGANPTGNTGDFNGEVTTAGSYDPFTGNAKRSVTDLVVPGTAGAYPLAFTRTANSRFTPAPPDDACFGDGGGWRHSYQWAVFDNGSVTDNGTGATYKTWAVAYPDGRVTIFRRGHSYSPAGETFLRGPAGTSDRLETDNSESDYPGFFILHLPDGGRVVFLGGIGQGRYRATQIIDPFNQATLLEYDTTHNRPYLLSKVTEPAGHSLQFFYDTYTSNGHPWVVLGEVRGFTPYNVVSADVGYTYDLFGNNGVNSPYLVLGHVYHYGEPSVNGTAVYPTGLVTALYYYGVYGNVNDGRRPLLQACYDPHYAGPLANLAYTYNQGPGQPWGCVEREGRAVNGTLADTVSQLYAPGGDPTEIRGDGPQRNFHYGQGAAGSFVQTGAKPYQLTSAGDFQGNWSCYAYNPKGDPHGWGYRRAIMDRRTKVTLFETEPFVGQTVKITFPPESNGLSATRTTTYEDPANPYYVRTITDERGLTTTYSRDANHHVTQVDYPDQSRENFDYETVNTGHGPFHRLICHTTRRRAEIRYAYGDADRPALPTSVRHPYLNDNAVTFGTTLAYDSGDRLALSRDERTLTTLFSYNFRHQLIRLTHADGPHVDYTYDDYGNLLTVANELNKTWRTAYDDYRRAISRTDPLTRTVAFDFARPGQSAYLHATANPGRVTQPSGRATTLSYSANWWPTQQTVGAGTPSDPIATTFGYDPEGRRLSATDPRNNTRSWTYDERGRPRTSTDALGHVVTRNYYPPGHPHAGLPQNVIAPGRSPGENLQTDFLDYDNLGQVKRTRDPARQVVNRQYDYAGQLLYLSDNRGTNTYGYDYLGRVGYLSYPDGTYEGYHRDPAGNVDGFVNRAGQSRTTTFDVRNRPSFARWSNYTGSDVSWAYDDAGRLVDFNNWSSALHYEYDDAGQPRSERAAVSGAPGAPLTTSYRYSSDGVVDQLTYPGGAMPAWALNGRNQSYGLYGMSYYVYLDNGWPSQRTLANGTVTYSAYDAAGRTVAIGSQRYSPSYQNLTYRTYGYAPNGQMTWFNRSYDQTGSNTENNTGDAYSYREDGALTSAAQDAQTVWGQPDAHGDSLPGSPLAAQRLGTYTYDQFGNRTAANLNGAVETYSPDTENRLWAVGGQAVAPDALGNSAAVRGWRYTFDADNQLRSADGPSGQHQEFLYDAAGRLVRRIENNVGTTYLYYAGAQLVEERDAANAPLFAYFHDRPGADTMLCRQNVTTGALVWYHHDARGALTHLSDAGGNVLEKYLYDAFGAPRVLDAAGNPRPGNASAYKNRFLFMAGYEWLEGLGLFHCGARFYRPDLGRWLSPDPAGFAASGTNLYAYCGNDPINQSDPSGLVVNGFDSYSFMQPNNPSSTSSAATAAYNVPTMFGGGQWQRLGGGLTDAMKKIGKENYAAYEAAVNDMVQQQWGDKVFLGGTESDIRDGNNHPVLRLMLDQPNDNHRYKLGDQTLYEEMNRYEKEVDAKNIQSLSWKSFVESAGGADTDFRHLANTAYFTYVGNLKNFSGNTYRGYEINYVGIGMYYAARGESISQMNSNIGIHNVIFNFGDPTAAKYAWARVGYDYYNWWTTSGD